MSANPEDRLRRGLRYLADEAPLFDGFAGKSVAIRADRSSERKRAPMVIAAAALACVGLLGTFVFGWSSSDENDDVASCPAGPSLRYGGVQYFRFEPIYTLPQRGAALSSGRMDTSVPGSVDTEACGPGKVRSVRLYLVPGVAQQVAVMTASDIWLAATAAPTASLEMLRSPWECTEARAADIDVVRVADEEGVVRGASFLTVRAQSQEMAPRSTWVQLRLKLPSTNLVSQAELATAAADARDISVSLFCDGSRFQVRSISVPPGD